MREKKLWDMIIRYVILESNKKELSTNTEIKNYYKRSDNLRMIIFFKIARLEKRVNEYENFKKMLVRPNNNLTI